MMRQNLETKRNRDSNNCTCNHFKVFFFFLFVVNKSQKLFILGLIPLIKKKKQLWQSISVKGIAKL